MATPQSVGTARGSNRLPVALVIGIIIGVLLRSELSPEMMGAIGNSRESRLQEVPLVDAPGARLGCYAACLLRERFGRHGGMLSCLEINAGKVAWPRNPGVNVNGSRSSSSSSSDVGDVGRSCWWNDDLTHDFSNRRGIIAEFLGKVAASDPSLTGSMVLELHDGSTSEPGFTNALLQGFRIPTLTGNCGTGYSPNASREPLPLAAGSCQAQKTIADAHFIQSRGYSEGGAESLREKVARASEATPWKDKAFAVRWRGGSTGRQFPGFPFPDPRFNQRVAVALLSKKHQAQAQELELQKAKGSSGGSRDSNGGGGGSSADGSSGSGSGGGSNSGGAATIKLDALLSNTVQMEAGDADAIRAAGLIGASMGVEEMVAARGLLDVDGNANSWDGLFWKLLSNSVVLKVESNHSQWYYKKLKRWQHFVPIKPDLSDLMEKVAWVCDPSNDAKLMAMAKASTELVAPLTFKAEVRRTAKMLKAVFKRPTPSKRPTTSNSQSTNEEKEDNGNGLATGGGGGAAGAAGSTAVASSSSSSLSFRDLVLAEANMRLLEAVEAFALSRDSNEAQPPLGAFTPPPRNQ